MSVLFFYNGIKDAKGEKLQKAHYSKGGYVTLPEETVTIYAKGERLSKKVRDVFTVENESDSQQDYFEDDKIRVSPNHPLYAEVLKALNLQNQRKAV